MSCVEEESVASKFFDKNEYIVSKSCVEYESVASKTCVED
jgi:hypothetical protein